MKNDELEKEISAFVKDEDVQKVLARDDGVRLMLFYLRMAAKSRANNEGGLIRFATCEGVGSLTTSEREKANQKQIEADMAIYKAAGLIEEVCEDEENGWKVIRLTKFGSIFPEAQKADGLA